MNIPYLKDINGKKVLHVQGEPFIMLAGEPHNSSSSSTGYMEQVWDNAEVLGMNCLLLPVSWEMLEPVEGEFDFSIVDGLIDQARRRGKKLGLLWFGSWKNAQCYYAPEWVKTDLERFKRAEVIKGQLFTKREKYYGFSYTSLSYLCEETMRADAKAFATLMQHLKEYDGVENTVVAVQVENEAGVMVAGREQSDEADARFAADVPAGFAEYMKAHAKTMVEDVRVAVENGAERGSWTEVFGAVADEVFSAYHVASFMQAIAQAGKQAYALPLFANCWLDKGDRPGVYPSGGPVARMMEVWRCCAPDIDVFAPDIYVRNFCDICDEYTRLGNPLLIPETATHSCAGSRQVYVVGHHHAMGYAPFGFEDLGQAFTAAESFLFGMDTEDPALKTPQDTGEYGWYTRTLNSMMPLMTQHYGTKKLQAVTGERKDEDTMLFDGYGFQIVTNPFAPPDLPQALPKNSICLAMQVESNEFILIVNHCNLAYFSTNPEYPNIDILALEEGRFEDGKWVKTRRLNGDEAVMLRFDKPTLLKMKLFAYGN